MTLLQGAFATLDQTEPTEVTGRVGALRGRQPTRQVRHPGRVQAGRPARACAPVRALRRCPETRVRGRRPTEVRGEVAPCRAALQDDAHIGARPVARPQEGAQAVGYAVV